MRPQALSRASDPLLQGEGHVACLLGNEAIVRGALEAGIAFAAGYPGTPSSEVTDAFARLAPARGIVFEYSVNEKIALEMAFAASLAGARSICAMKHLGLMVAGDPLSTIPYVGVGAGMVIVSAGDPSCHTSPNEQDQRMLGPMLHLPTLDPSTPQEALELTRLAFEISERSRLPVLLRVTTRVCHARAVVRFGRLRQGIVTGFVKDPRRLVPIPDNARRLRLEIPGRLAAAGAAMHEAGLFRRQGSARQAILAAGAPIAACADVLAEDGLEGEVVFATLRGLHPLPDDQLAALMADVDRVLVIEELSPFVEDALAALAHRRRIPVEILGKRTGHVPEAFECGPDVVRRALNSAFSVGRAPASARVAWDVPGRPPSLCPECPHRATYFAAKAAFGDEQLYFNDIGCYTLGYGRPLDVADALLCMGAGFTLAAGVARVTGQRTVGFLGDSTFFHAGMPALLNAIKENVNMVAVILDNEVTAMTGFQESPAIDETPAGPQRRVRIADVARSLGARHVETIDPADLASSIAAFERARDATGVSVVIAERPCPVHVARSTAAGPATARYEIDHDLCQHCGRSESGMRCSQPVTRGLESHMARARALEIHPEGGAGRSTVARSPVAPCETRCPLGLCVQGYAGHVASGQHALALELVMERCPLPDSTCRACHRPCESACVRAALDGSVAINDIKRFIMDWAAATGATYAPRREAPSGKRVAIVGAGPAGLAAAHDLVLRGHAATLYDAATEPGGLLVSGIPPFRLPREAVRRDTQRILDLGVEFRGGMRLGRDMTLAELLEGDHAAVFLAVGATLPLSVDLGPGRARVIEALPWLTGALAGEDVDGGRRVVVVGGGNAAMDAARVALRRGAESAVVVYRRGREDMPALPDEIEAAEREGVEIRCRLAPLHLAEHGGEPGLACARTVPGDRDATGRARAVVLGDEQEIIPADLVLIAVGQSPDTEGIGTSEGLLARQADGSLVVDEITCATSDPRVFAGGDVVQGDRTITGAMALGLRAAWGIDRRLRGSEAADRRMPPPRPGAWPGQGVAGAPVRFTRADEVARRQAPELPLEDALASFAETRAGLTEEQARIEAHRCAACGLCGNCRACLDLFGCPAFHVENGLIRIDPVLCTGCGECADLCPNGAIRRVEGEDR